jgi:hypothetical protein
MARHHSLLAAAAAFAACSSGHIADLPQPAAPAPTPAPVVVAKPPTSTLPWYTDLATAQAAAKASGKPILSLRLLGRLDEELSCANSRFFRVVLYANAELSVWLRDHFILHWSSERPVPKITIDMGDGRRIETTIAGNSAHYVLDADGRVLDVLPGLMTPKAFRHELEGSLALAAAVAAAGADERTALIQRHHDAAVAAIDAEWTKLGAAEIPEQTYELMLAAAERVTYSKMRVEMPVVKLARLGATPQGIAVESPVWEQIGIRLLADLGLEHDATPATGVAAPPAILDAESRALVAGLAPVDWNHPDQPLDEAQLAALIRNFEASIVADTALDLLRLRREIHAQLAGYASVGQPADFATVNEWIYSYLFRTPSYDAWLGLATPGTFTGLPHSGVVITE